MTEPEIETKPSLLDAFGARPDAPPAAAAPTVGALVPQQRVGAVRVEVKRDDREVLQRIKVMAAAAGEEWYWRWPIKNKGRTEWKDGPTIKLANDVARVYGNCEVDCRVIDVGDLWILMARFLDLETGFAMTRPFQQRKSQTSIGADPERQRDMALQIGVSKAIRNVVCNSLQSISEFAFEEAKNSLVNRIGKDLPRWRESTLKKLETKEIDVKRVEAVMGRAAGEWLAPDIAQVIAMAKSITDGMATYDETFPPLGKPVEEEEHKGASQMEQFSSLEGGDPQS